MQLMRLQWLRLERRSLRPEWYQNRQARGQLELLPNQQGLGHNVTVREAEQYGKRNTTQAVSEVRRVVPDLRPA
jgi:signal transduction histidine kinase